MSRQGCHHDRWAFCTLLTGPEAPEALHAQFKAGFSAFCLLSHPPFEAVLMSKDVKSLPGEGLGWGKEGEAGLAKLSSQSLCYLGVGVV